MTNESLPPESTRGNPWQQFAQAHQIGQVVPGKVTKLTLFGAFVQVWEGVVGLVHIRALANRVLDHPREVVQVGDEALVKIVDIDLRNLRVSLSLKDAHENVAEADTADDNPVLSDVPTANDGGKTPRDEFEQGYAAARSRFEARRRRDGEARAEIQLGPTQP